MAGKKESALVAVISGLTSAQAAQMAKEIMKSKEKFAPHGRGTIAAGNAVICFKGTVLEDITNAPICGSSVEYKSSSALAHEIERLSRNPREIRQKGRMGRQLVEQKYQFDTYVKRHQELYESILKESLDGKGKRYE